MRSPRRRKRICKHGHDMEILGSDAGNRCRECGVIRHRVYRNANREKWNLQAKHVKRIKRYGLTPQNYDDFLKKQEGKCAICRLVPEESYMKRTFHIDHCHSTGVVRGLLCQTCNLMLGFAKDNTNILREAIKYLS